MTWSGTTAADIGSYELYLFYLTAISKEATKGRF